MEPIAEYQRRVMPKGTVTIPVEVRRLLGVKPGGKVTFCIVGRKRVELRATVSLAATYASVRPKRRPLDFKKMRDRAIEDHVRKAVQKARE